MAGEEGIWQRLGGVAELDLHPARSDLAVAKVPARRFTGEIEADAVSIGAGDPAGEFATRVQAHPHQAAGSSPSVPRLDQRPVYSRRADFEHVRCGAQDRIGVRGRPQGETKGCAAVKDTEWEAFVAEMNIYKPTRIIVRP